MPRKSTVNREANVKRQTKETLINVSLSIDGVGEAKIDSGIGFFDHMLESFAKHGFFDLTLSCEGDLHVDGHHSVEDCGIVLGQAIKEAVAAKEGMVRYGHCILPMDDALVLTAVDLCGRPYFEYDAKFETEKIGYLDTELIREFFYAISYSARMNLHIKVLSGSNSHHICEAMFKSFARSLDMATSLDQRITNVLSTKGSL
ncbi:MAG: imidazoleglycerol-phosphate dehydratase HisB [Lachnospiraceae bacterium]|nr:imidazoleglycerol-phosphate dehydratase HisB [Lachnospiraceae bacterium]